MKTIRWILISFVCLIIFHLAGCFEVNKQTGINPTPKKLIEKGFYIYVLPDIETSEQPELYIYSWKRHCNPSPDSRSNPITVRYEQPAITLIVGPWGVIDAKVPTKKVKITNPWFKAETAEYNTQGVLSFIDKFENPLQVRARNLAITETIRLVNELEYLGPPSQTVSNPWGYSTCDRSILERFGLY